MQMLKSEYEGDSSVIVGVLYLEYLIILKIEVGVV